jgi:hypothetical protein
MERGTHEYAALLLLLVRVCSVLSFWNLSGISLSSPPSANNTCIVAKEGCKREREK